jgi:chemotaxis signal transduction protein
VRGVVSQRGRILTVIDALPLLPPTAPLNDATAAAPPLTSPPASPLAPTPTQAHASLIVSLRGDEQLALSVERIEHDIELFDDGDDDAPDTTANISPGSQLLRRTIRHPSGAIALLDTAHLFEAAMRGVERRRRRQ